MNRVHEPSLRPLAEALAEPELRWHWRNCRSLGLSLAFWPLDWGFGFDRWDDVYGGSMRVGIGPLLVEVSYGIGGSNSPFALCEVAAWDRALTYEGARKDGASPQNPEPPSPAGNDRA